MSRIRIRTSILGLVFVVGLLWALPVLADGHDDLEPCFSDKGCFASNKAISDLPHPGDGTNLAPWVIPEDVGVDAWLMDLADKIKELQDAGAGDAQLTLIEFNENDVTHRICRFPVGVEASEICDDPLPGVPPTVGVDLPFSYLLVGGAVIALSLVAGGLVLRRRTTIAKPA